MWHNVYSQQHTYMSSSSRSNRWGLSHWDPYTVHRGSCLELYYCNMVEWFWWDSSLILTTNWFPSVLWHCWFGHLACKNRPWNDLQCVEWDVKPLNYYYLYPSPSSFTSTSTHPRRTSVPCPPVPAKIYLDRHSIATYSNQLTEYRLKVYKISSRSVD